MADQAAGSVTVAITTCPSDRPASSSERTCVQPGAELDEPLPRRFARHAVKFAGACRGGDQVAAAWSRAQVTSCG